MQSLIRRVGIALVLSILCLGTGAKALAQLPTSEERLKILTDPESLKKKLDKDKARPPLELFRTQVAPFDILPFVKANHWTTLSLEARANYDDYHGFWQTAPVRLLGMPHEIVFRREAHLLKTQRSRISMQVLLPEIPKELSLELSRPESIRPDEPSPTAIRPLFPHQMLVLILTKETGDAYYNWTKYQALFPHGLDRADNVALEKARYYRLVLPLDRDKPPLSANPLTWTTLSHVVWDGMSPDNLNPYQQQAMLDWLHWGGQLIVVGGGPSISILKDSFLAPYLPAEPTGENKLLNQDDLKPLSQTYPPPYGGMNPDNPDDPRTDYIPEPYRPQDQLYRDPVPIKPAPNRPVYLAGLKPNPGAVGIPLGEASEWLVGVEKRVGRGRVLMLGLNPTDPALASWTGLDTFVKRVILRRPEESLASRSPWDGQGYTAPRYGPLPGPDLTWFRFFSRDMGSSLPRIRPEDKGPKVATTYPTSTLVVAPPGPMGSSPLPPDLDSASIQVPDAAVAEWIDSSALPRLSRDALKESSGIKIPNSSFVLKVILAYILALVPLNWLICRYVFNRREMAWVVVPILSLVFAIGVERAAAYDIGYNSACDEIDLIETHAGYPRAHVSRFASLYSTGRTRYTLSYPDDPTALALPLNNGLSLRGEDVTNSVWQSFPIPALEGYLVQPRSQSLFRAEQMLTLDGTITFETEEAGAGRKVVNGTSLELRDAVLVDVGNEKNRKETYLGTIGPGASVEVKELSRPGPTSVDTDAIALGREAFLKAFRTEFEDRPENVGEIRLVAWVQKAVPGQKIEPAVDRHRGFTAVIVHLRQGPPPSPDGPIYNAQAKKNASLETPTEEDQIAKPTPAVGPGSAFPKPANSPRTAPAGRPATKTRSGR